MSDKASIYEALALVMTDVGHVAKRDKNEHQRFMFRGIDAVLNAVGPVLRKHGVIVVPTVIDASYAAVETTTGKPSTACRVFVSYTFYGPAGDNIVATVIGEAWDAGDKAAPKAMSVAFRTALLQALALPTDEPDPDASTYERAPNTSQPQATRTMSRKPAASKAAVPTPGPAPEPEDDWQPPVDNSGEPLSPAQLTKLHVCFGEAEPKMGRDEALLWLTTITGREITTSKELTKAEANKAINVLEADRLASERPAS